MNQYKVFIIGNSLYATGIDRILANSELVEVIGTAPTLLTALTLLKTLDPDVIIVADTFEKETIATVGAFVTRCSHLPILRTDLNGDQIQLITSQRLYACGSDLLTTITTLPKNLSGGRDICY